MSQENVEIVRAMNEAFNRGDFARATESLHRDAELHPLPDIPDAEPCYGRHECVRGFALWASAWEKQHFEPQEVTEVGDCVLIRARLSGTGRGSGVEAKVELFFAWTVREGKAHRCFIRATRSEALKAVGLEE